jgi:hypothetical protein
MQGRMFIFCWVWYLISVGATDIARITDRLGMRLLQRWRSGLWPSRLWHHVVLHIFEPWRWKLYVALKRFELRAGLCGIATQKAKNKCVSVCGEGAAVLDVNSTEMCIYHTVLWIGIPIYKKKVPKRRKGMTACRFYHILTWPSIVIVLCIKVLPNDEVALGI